MDIQILSKAKFELGIVAKLYAVFVTTLQKNALDPGLGPI